VWWRCLLAALAAGPSLRPVLLAAQKSPGVGEAELRAVFPRARRFSDERGAPPAWDAYVADAAGRDSLAGWVFRTPDVPPEAGGYSGPIDALVGLDVAGALTGVRVLEYHESLKSSRGDFLATPGFLEQFAGKSIADGFRVRRDVDAVAGATITSSALARGIRNAARRVAAARASTSAADPSGAPPTVTTVALDRLSRTSWSELVAARMAVRVVMPDLTVSLLYVRDPAFGEALMGLPFRSVYDALGESVHERHLLVVGFDGPRAAGPLPRIFVAQSGDTLTLVPDDFMELRAITAGTLAGAFARPGLWLVRKSLDPTLPFQVGVRRCCGDPPVVADYALGPAVPAARARAADSAPAAAPRSSAPPGDRPVRALEVPGSSAGASAAEAEPTPGSAPRPGPAAAAPPALSEAAAASTQARGSGGLGTLLLVFGGTALALCVVGVAAIRARRRSRIG
jgi:hypothetical protein